MLCTTSPTRLKSKPQIACFPLIQSQSAKNERLCFCFAGSAVRRVFVEILNAVFVDEKVRLQFACNANNVFVVVLNPASNFFTINELHNDGRPIFGETINVLRLAESRFRRGLPPISPAGVLMMSCSYCHVPQYSGFDVNI